MSIAKGRGLCCVSRRLFPFRSRADHAINRVQSCVPLRQFVREGEVVAEITDPVTGDLHPVRASTSGVFCARPATRIAEIHKRLGNIAGTRSFRDGPLLSP